MKYILPLSVSLFFLSNITFAMQEAIKNEKNQASSPKKEKELVKSTSKTSSFFAKVKKEKKVSIDEGDREETSYNYLIDLIKVNDLNKLKSIISDHQDLVLSANEKGENIIYFMALKNSVKVLEMVTNIVKPDLALQAINARSIAEMSALHVAAQQGSHDVAMLFLSLGAAVDLPGPAKITAYIMALNKQDLVMACILASFGARVNMSPIGEEQKTIKMIKLFSSECRCFIVDNFCKTGLKLDENSLNMLVNHLKDHFVCSYKQIKFDQNLATYTCVNNEDEESLEELMASIEKDCAGTNKGDAKAD
jgi:hypothetical protein